MKLAVLVVLRTAFGGATRRAFALLVVLRTAFGGATRRAFALLVVPALLVAAGSAHAKGLTIDDMLAMQRVGDPVVQPGGKLVAFTVRDTDVAENRGRTDVYVAAVDGTSVRRLTNHPDNDDSPQWSPDGKWVYFVSKRSGKAEVWRVSPDGGDAQQVTKLPIDIEGFKIFPDGKRLVVGLDVWPDAKSLIDSVAKDAAKDKSKVKAKIYDQLLFRHWDQWEDGKYIHLFTWTPPELGGKADDAKDLTPGQLTDSPQHPFGDMSDVDISPDGKIVAFAERVSGRENAWRTNSDILFVPSNGSAKPTDVTAANKAYELGPAFSPDGKWLAYRQMVRPGYEADRQRIAIMDVANRKPRTITEAWDRSVDTLTWSPDGKTLYATADNLGNRALFSVDVATGAVKPLVDKGTIGTPVVAGDRLVFSRDSLAKPAELWSVKLDGSDPKQITHLNDARVKAIDWGAYEQFSFKGAKGDTVYGFAMKPAGFAAGRKYPVAFIIHGGPQGSMGDHFHYRWNPEVFAGHGFGVVFVDFHGSTGYGQAFTDTINGDWGGAPYDDLMAGLDAALAKYSWLDKDHMAALGASYGGFMINWVNGKTDRFKALVCHDGNLDERMAYYDTEELWFPEWEHGGLPWEKPEGYTKHNPIDLVKNWKTPTLVIHGGNDFRVVDTQGMGTFTALQRKSIPSRFVYFPDENHWVVKPQNSILWHHEVLAWIDKFTKR